MKRGTEGSREGVKREVGDGKGGKVLKEAWLSETDLLWEEVGFIPTIIPARGLGTVQYRYLMDQMVELK